MEILGIHMTISFEYLIINFQCQYFIQHLTKIITKSTVQACQSEWIMELNSMDLSEIVNLKEYFSWSLDWGKGSVFKGKVSPLSPP